MNDILLSSYFFQCNHDFFLYFYYFITCRNVSFVQIEKYFYLSAVIETEWTWTGLLKGWIFYCAEGKIFLLGYDWKIICSENDINGIGKLVISFLFHEENGFYKMSTHVWYYFFLRISVLNRGSSTQYYIKIKEAPGFEFYDFGNDSRNYEYLYYSYPFSLNPL